jgi:3-hydroxybutyryl-CoA dehydrogenase
MSRVFRMDVKRVAVIGCGTLGTDVTILVLRGGCEVFLYDLKKRSADRACEMIRGSFVACPDTPVDLSSALHVLDKTEEVPHDVDMIVECIHEDVMAKKRLFEDLDDQLPRKVIFATTSSSITITELASYTNRPAQFIGILFPPDPILTEGIEIAKGLKTADETVEIATQFVNRLGKKPLIIGDSPGFVLPRILFMIINEAAFALMEGVASKEDIDLAMRLGANYPQGPLEWADHIGLDVCLRTISHLYGELKDPRYRPCPLLSRMVHAGYLGKKVGRGFYEYGGKLKDTTSTAR